MIDYASLSRTAHLQRAVGLGDNRLALSGE
jgi:hypothetical protein